MLTCVCSDQTVDAYSSWGLTRVLYDSDLTCSCFVLMLRLRKPSVLFAFDVILEMCVFQQRSWLMSTPVFCILHGEQCLAMEVVGKFYGVSIPCYMEYLAFAWIEFHIP